MAMNTIVIINTTAFIIIIWPWVIYNVVFDQKGSSDLPPASRRAASPLGVDGDAATMTLNAHRRLIRTYFFCNQRCDRGRGSFLLHLNQVILSFFTAGGMFQVATRVVRATVEMVAAAHGPRHRTAAVSATR